MSFPAYLDHKGSGVAWLGEVPSHWDIAALKRKVRLVTQRADRRTFPIALENIEGWTGRFLPTESEFEGDGVAFELGDILYGKLRPYLAKILVAEGRGEAIGDFHVLRPLDQHPEYLGYLLRTTELVSVVDGSTYGSKMPRASWEFLGSLAIPFPPLGEQAAIAAFLDRETAKIDALVVEQKRLIALLREKRQAVISHAVSKGLHRDTPKKDSGIQWLGEIPAHWAVAPLKYLVSFRSGGTPSKDNPDYWNGEIPWASAKDLKVELLSDTQDHLTQHAIDSGVAATVPAGAVVVLVRGMMLARLFPVCELAVPMTINQDCKALLPGSNIIGSYLAWALRGTADETLNRLDEAGHGTKALRMEAWTSMELPVPPLNEQHAIVAHLSEATNLIDRLADEAQVAINLLQERRAALISAAVKGTIDVRGAIPLGNVVSINTARTSELQPSIRAYVGALSIRAVGLMGRMAVMKGGYLAESYAGVSELAGTYQRDAAGPFCRAVIDGMERDAAKAFGIQIIEPGEEGEKVTYRVPSNFVSPASDLRKLLGEHRAKRLASLFDLLKDLNRDGVEAIATIFAVWNDLLACGKSADDDAVIRGVLEDWHPEKTVKFNHETLAHWLAWMRRNHIVPDGTAPRTDHQGSLFQ